MDFIQLALEYKPLNLGQGLPDDLIPEYAVNALKDVATEPMINNHQYTRGFVSTSIRRNDFVNIKKNKYGTHEFLRSKFNKNSF